MLLPIRPETAGPCPPQLEALTVSGLHWGHVGGSAALQDGVADEVGKEGHTGQQAAHICRQREGARLS